MRLDVARDGHPNDCLPENLAATEIDRSWPIAGIDAIRLSGR
jgi:hypothetical protein